MLSACILAKDEASVLPQCIESLYPFFDQIVVIDTGSIDTSPQIASRLGADLFFFQWRNDFAAARNFGIQCCYGDWILMIDADERLIDFPLDALQPLFHNPEIGGIEIQIRNWLEPEHQRWNTHRSVRLFRNLPSLRYTGAIHEQISPSIYAAGLAVRPAMVVIEHFGYLHIDADKIARNRTLLEQELQRSPNDPYLLYHLGMTEFAAAHYDKAEHLLQNAVASQQLTTPQEHMARIRLGQIALRKEAWERLEHLLNFQSTDSNLEGFRRFILGIAALVQGDAQKALALLETDIVRRSSLITPAELQQALNTCKQILGQ